MTKRITSIKDYELIKDYGYAADQERCRAFAEVPTTLPSDEMIISGSTDC